MIDRTHFSRMAALAVALGIGAAAGSIPAVAFADTSDSTTSSADSSSASRDTTVDPTSTGIPSGAREPSASGDATDKFDSPGGLSADAELKKRMQDYLSGAGLTEQWDSKAISKLTLELSDDRSANLPTQDGKLPLPDPTSRSDFGSDSGPVTSESKEDLGVLVGPCPTRTC